MPRASTKTAKTLRVQLGCLAIGTIDAFEGDKDKQGRAAYSVLSDFARDLMSEHPELVKLAEASEHAKRAKSWDLICGIFGVDPNDVDGFKFQVGSDFVQFSPSRKQKTSTVSGGSTPLRAAS